MKTVAVFPLIQNLEFVKVVMQQTVYHGIYESDFIDVRKCISL